jgi:hypothetical protein
MSNSSPSGMKSKCASQLHWATLRCQEGSIEAHVTAGRRFCSNKCPTLKVGPACSKANQPRQPIVAGVRRGSLHHGTALAMGLLPFPCLNTRDSISPSSSPQTPPSLLKPIIHVLSSSPQDSALCSLGSTELSIFRKCAGPELIPWKVTRSYQCILDSPDFRSIPDPQAIDSSG